MQTQTQIQTTTNAGAKLHDAVPIGVCETMADRIDLNRADRIRSVPFRSVPIRCACATRRTAHAPLTCEEAHGVRRTSRLRTTEVGASASWRRTNELEWGPNKFINRFID